MRKNKRIVGLALAMAMSASTFTALAAQSGWVLDGNDWYHYDNEGEMEYDVWRGYTDGNKYYLGEEGAMLRSQLVDDEYYVNSSGARVSNEWRLVDIDDEEDSRWMFFGENAKSYKNGWKTINGQRYHFDDAGHMDYGWLDAEGNMVDADGEFDENSWKEATYYCGDNTTGWRVQDQWVAVTEFDDADDQYGDKEVVWLYFDNNGKKVVNKSKAIDGKKYMFDENGAMVTEWYGSATPSDAEYKHYDEETGYLAKGKWFQAVPSLEQDADDYYEDTLRWFYASKTGETYKNTIKKIDGKRYIFDENGIMKTGFIVVDENSAIVDVLGNAEDNEMPTADELKEIDLTTGSLMYFNENGARETGKMTIALEDDTYTLKFESNGEAAHGVDDNYLYDHGILIKATENKYEVATVDGKDFLVNKSGKVQKAGSYKDGAEGLVYTVVGNNTDGFEISVVTE